MAAPQVIKSTVDISQRVPGFPGVIGGIVIPAVRGSVDELELVTDESDLLNRLTANGKIEIGYDNSYWSALQFLTSANRLYVARAANTSLYGGTIIRTTPAVASNAAIAAGMTDPDAYTFSGTSVTAAAEITRFTADDDGDISGVDILTTLAANLMVIGSRYIITLVGTTDFTLIGADASEVGSIFTATAYGTALSTGTVQLITEPARTDETFIEFSSPTIDYYCWFGVASAWQKAALIQVGDYCVPSIASYVAGWAGLVLKCSLGGGILVTSAAEPAWTATPTIGDVIVDTGISWTVVAITDMATDPELFGKTAIPVVIPEAATGTVICTYMEKMIDNLTGIFSSTPAANTITVTNAVNGTVSTAPTNGSSDWTIDPVITVEGTDAADEEDAFLLYGVNPGLWNNDISIEIYNYRTSPDTVREEGAFTIGIYYKDILQESYTCSMIDGTKDGYGNNIYIEDVLLQSNFIRAIDAGSGLLYPKEQTIALDVEKGSDGSAVTDANMITALDMFNNPNDAPILLVMDGGWTTKSYQRAIDALCDTRQDCVGLLSCRYVDEASSSYMAAIVDYRNNVLNLNSSNSAMYSPYVQIYDKFNDRELWVSPDGYAASVVSRTFANYELWYPAAGFRRGLLNVLDVKHRWSQGEMNTLYDDQINPIRFAPGKGILIWGQKTLSARPTSLDRLNVKLLLCYIQPAIASLLDDFVFEFNDVITRNQITIIMDEYMENIKARRGVYAFQSVCDESNNTPAVIDANEMEVWLYIQPTKSAEIIRFKTIITKTGATFGAF